MSLVKFVAAPFATIAPINNISGVLSIKVSCMILMFTISNVNGQNLDSLKSQIELSRGVALSDIYFQLAYEVVEFDYRLGLAYSDSSFRVAQLYADTLRMIKAQRIKTLAYRRLGEMDSSLNLSLRILPVARSKNYHTEIKYLLNGIAMSYLNKSFYDKALRYSLESLAVRRHHGTQMEVSAALHNIGLVYFKLEDIDKALDYYLKSMKVKERIMYLSDLDVLCTDIGLCYAYKGEYSKARQFINKAKSYCTTTCSAEIQMNMNFCLGITYFGLGDYRVATTLFRQSLHIAEVRNNERFQLDNIFFLLRVHLAENDKSAVKTLLMSSEKLLVSNISYSEGAIQLYSELIRFHEKAGDLVKVNLYQTRYIELKDSLFSLRFTRDLMRIEANHIASESKAKLESQSKILVLNDEIMKRQRFLNLFMGVIAALCVVMAVILIRNIRLKRLVNRSLERGVRERTSELEESKTLSQRSSEQRNLEIRRVCVEVRNTLATIKGLCILGQTDPESNRKSVYLQKIDHTSDQLLNVVSRFTEH